MKKRCSCTGRYAVCVTCFSCMSAVSTCDIVHIHFHYRTENASIVLPAAAVLQCLAVCCRRCTLIHCRCTHAYAYLRFWRRPCPLSTSTCNMVSTHLTLHCFLHLHACMQAIDQAPEDAQQRAVYLCNAAACYLKKEMWQLAVEQCTKALTINDSYVKVCFGGCAAAACMSREVA